MVPKRNETVVILGITIEENAKHIFPKKSFIPKQWVNFQGLEEEGFLVRELFVRVGQTPFLEKFSSWNYGPYALFFGTMCQDRVNIKGTIEGNEVIISPATNVVASGCVEEGLVFEKDWKRR